MQLINTDGMAFIGPGSEWFWTALSGLVLAVTFVAIYRQLRTQGAANAVQRMEALQGRWDSARIIHARLAVAIWRKSSPTPAPDFETQAALNWLGGFFEDLSDLEEGGHLTWREVMNTWGEGLPGWWAAFGPAIQELRPRSPKVFLGFERIAQRAAAEGRHPGGTWSFQEVQFDEFIDAQIGRNSARLRMLRDIETGVIPTMRMQAVPESAQHEVAPSSPPA